MTVILGYHEILPPHSENYLNPFAIGYDTFDSHLRLTKELNYETCGHKEILKLIDGRLSDQHKVIFSFDDGHASNYYYAINLLKKYGMAAIFFITTSHIDTNDSWLNSAQIRKMADLGMVFSSHTHNHLYLDSLSKHQIISELSKSKSILEDITEQKIHYLSCPGGRYQQSLGQIAHDLGYSHIFTSIPGINHNVSKYTIPFLERYVVKNSLSETNFRQIISHNKVFFYRSSYFLKVRLKKILGNRIYYFCWKKIRTKG